MKRTAQQNIILHTLISKLKITAEIKQSLVFQFTNERTTISSEMQSHECQSLIKHLQDLTKEDTTEVRCDKMRKKIISMSHEMGWQIEQSGKLKADIKRIENWCNKYGFKHKNLNEYSYTELPTLVSQFEQLYEFTMGKAYSN